MRTYTLNAEQLAIAEDCETIIGYSFANRCLIAEAITHSSVANTRLRSNERLEFLGDTALGFVVCNYLFARFPDWTEGDLTKVKSIVVSRQSCGVWAEQLGLRRVLVVGKGVTIKGDLPPSLMSNAFEAIIGAILLDGGLEAVENFLTPLVAERVEEVLATVSELNYKSELQQLSQREFGLPPIYTLLEERGPDHDKSFLVAAQIASRSFEPAWGKNKKEAEQRAAGKALAALNCGKDT